MEVSWFIALLHLTARHRIDEIELLYLNAEGLIALKADSLRPQDQIDVQALRNIIEGKELALIDWEYAAIGDPFFDLATIAEQHQFDCDETSGLLRAYFGEALEEDARRLDRYRTFYHSLNCLWLASVRK